MPLGGASQGINDSGTPVWRNADSSRNPHPGHSQSLATPDFQKMFDLGWNFKATTKVVNGGGSALWSVAGTENDPGWGISSGNGNINGFHFDRVNGNELEVRLWQSPSMINLGTGSADQYHTFELIGSAGSSLFDFYIDGQLQSAGNDLKSTEGLSGFQNTLVFRNDSTSSIREVFWNEVSLTALLPEPTSFCLLALSGLMISSRANRVVHVRQ